jgi:hypothetical protein
LKVLVSGAEQTQLIPATCASVGAQSGEISGADDGEVEILREMMGNTISPVEPGSAHGAGLGLRFSAHEMIDDERAIGLGEELGEADGACGCVPDVEVARAFLELIILNGSALREMAAQLGDAFPLTHEFDFGKAKLLPFCKIFGRFVGQIGLSKCSVNRCVYHGSLSPRVIFSPAAKRRNQRTLLGWLECVLSRDPRDFCRRTQRSPD